MLEEPLQGADRLKQHKVLKEPLQHAELDILLETKMDQKVKFTSIDSKSLALRVQRSKGRNSMFYC